MLKYNVPVLLLGFNRPDTMQRVFDRVAAIRPTHLFVAVDGPRPDVPTDHGRCEEVRRIIDSVDWPCELRTRFNSKNLGCKQAIETAISWFFESVERGIILEDDCLPHDSFFSFCDCVLERYACNENVMCVSGDNFISDGSSGGPVERPSYYFTKYMHCWGWATWRRAWRHYCPDLNNSDGQTDAEVIARFPTSNDELRYWSKRFQRVRSGRINTWDYGWQHAIWKNKGLVVAPRVNLVQNIGIGDDATHTTGGGGNVAAPSARELTLASHPESISQDVDADQREAEQYYRFGKKTVVDRTLAELRRAWHRQFHTHRAA